MKNVSSGFKEAVKKFGKELDVLITYGNTTITSSQINYFNYSFDGGVMKSVMRKLEIDVPNDIALETEINAKAGLKVNGSYEYIDYGNFFVYSTEKKEDTNSYRIVCYDKMINAMKDYTGLDSSLSFEFPMTLSDYINYVCRTMGTTFYNHGSHFPNYDRVLEYDPFVDATGKSLGYTFRDVLDDIAEATGSIVMFKWASNYSNHPQMYLVYANETNFEIDESSLKDVNVDFGKRYGPINSVVLSRSGESDNIYYQLQSSVISNGLCEVKIIDNQIMNGNDRADYTANICNALNGGGLIGTDRIKYFINDFKSTGIMCLDPYDIYNVTIGDATYQCIMFNDEIIIEQGLEENVYTEMPVESETDYKKADTTDRRINQAYLMVNKQQGEIIGYVSDIEEYKKLNNDRVLQVEKKNSSLETRMGSTDLIIKAMKTDIVDAQKTTINSMVTININGITVSTSESAIATLINNERFVVKNGDTPLAFFGYDSADNTTKSYVEHLTVNTYFIAGHHRIEKININGEDRTGWFYIG